MASRLLLHRLRSRLPQPSTAAAFTNRYFPFSPTIPKSPNPNPIPFFPNPAASSASAFRFLSLSTPRPRISTRPKKVDIGARARKLQERRLWTYALAFSGVAFFVFIVLSTFQDELVFYVTPTDLIAKYELNPEKDKFRLGGLVLEGSVSQPASSPAMEFVVTDLMTDILVRYEGAVPDLFREGHSVVVEGKVKPLDEIDAVDRKKGGVVEKAMSGKCYFSASEVLAKHDEKYMPKEVSQAIEKHRKMLQAEEGEGKGKGKGEGKGEKCQEEGVEK